MPSLSQGAQVLEAGIKFVTQFDASGLDDAKKETSGFLDGFSDSMKKVSVVTGVAGAAVTAFSKNSVDYLKQVVGSSKALSTQTGMTVEQSSSLLAVFDKMNIKSDQVSAAFRTFSKQIAGAADSTSDQALAAKDLQNKTEAAQIAIKQITDEINKHGDATGELHNKLDTLNIDIETYKKKLTDTTNPLQKLDVATKNVDGSTRSFNDILLDVADKFKDMKNGPEKTAMAMQLFGRQGQGMVKVLNQGSQGIKDMEAEADKLGLTITDKNITAINEYIKSNKRLEESHNSLRIAVGTQTAPVLAQFNNSLNDMTLKLIGTDSPFRQVTVDVLAFGGPVLGAVSATAGLLSNLSDALPLLGKFGKALKMEAAFAAISSLVSTQLPGLTGAITIAGQAWTVAFPVAGILADMALVYEAVMSIKGAYEAVNNAQTAADNSVSSYKASHSRLQDLQKNGTAEQKANATKALKAGYATGTNSASRGWHPVGENGPEMVYFQGGEQVKTAGQTANMQPSGHSYVIQQMIVQVPNNATMNTVIDSIDQNNLLATKGFAPTRSS